MNNINIDKISRDIKTKLTYAMRNVGRKSVNIIKKSIAIDYPPASDPGEPPHKRTGLLYRSIATGTQTIGNEITLNLTVDTPCAAYLEYGTRKMAARPYVEKVVQQHYDMLLDELNK